MSSNAIDDEVQAAIATQHREELAECRKLLQFGVSEMQAWTGRGIKRGADRLIVAEAARATKTFEAVIRLSEAGFGEQGVMLDRALFEGMAVAHWVSDNRREAVRLFSRHAKYSAVLWKETFGSLGWLDETEQGDAPAIGPKQREEFSSLFGKYGEKAWVRRGLPSLLRAIEHLWDEDGRRELWTAHNVANRYSNQILHSTATSTGAATTAITADSLHLGIGASNEFVSRALFPAYWTYGQTFRLVIRVFRLRSNDRFRAIYPAGL